MKNYLQYFSCFLKLYYQILYLLLKVQKKEKSILNKKEKYKYNSFFYFVNKFERNKDLNIKKSCIKLNKEFIHVLKKNKFKEFEIFIIYIIFFSFFISFVYSSSSISLRIYGTGKKKVFLNNPTPDCLPRFTLPNEVYINNVKQDQVVSEYNFVEENNKIILVWNDTVTRCNCLFLECKDIKEINFTNFDTSQVETMYAMFYECEGLTSLDLSNFITSKVIYMNMMFIRCKSLKSLNLSSFDTSQVQYMDSMFEDCNSLVSFDISNFNTSQVIKML